MPDAPTSLPQGDPHRESARVLVADDHDINRLLLTAMLRRLGCQADVANDGAEALAMIARARAAGQAYRLVLMDVQMPVLDGLAATRRCRDSGVSADELPIVALTASDDAGTVAACLAAGMQAHLAKPATLAGMDATLARWGGERAAGSRRVTPLGVSASVRDRYAQRRAETVAAVAALDVADAASRDHVADLLHKLAGTAAMLGEPALGNAAHALEQALTQGPADHIDTAIAAFCSVAAGTRPMVAG